jgi:hypothetical protein
MIANGKDRKLTENTGTPPDVSGAMQNWFQPITFSRITKTTQNYIVIETKEDVSFQGVWQPFSPKQLTIKPEGQRSWSWFTCHAEPGLVLLPDEIISYLGVQYRVMAQNDYRLYGYVEYHLIQDYTGEP